MPTPHRLGARSADPPQAPSRRRRWLLGGLALAAAAGAALWQGWPFVRSYVRPAARRRPRPRRHPWAQPLTEPGLSNFYRVSDVLYRGAQPSPEGMKRLEAMGIRTVVNLRRLHSNRTEAAGTSLRCLDVRVNPFDPEFDEVVRFLRIVRDPNVHPVYVHCQRGIDRTGMMCAAYRMVECGWTADEAVDEMVHGPFGYDGVFRNVPTFLRRLDVARIRRELAAGT